MSINGFSIVVCCFNSRDRIEETLRHLWNMEIPAGTDCEVILVNNSSKDDTAALAARSIAENNRGKVQARIVDEPTPGLSFARTRGIRESRYDVIIFCDDDNHLAPDYLTVASEILRNNPKAGVVGCWAKPAFSVEGREWLVDFFRAMAIGPQGSQDGPVEWIYGAGMIIRKAVFEKMRERKLEFHLTDRIGDVKMSGGDAETSILARHLGFEVYYSSKLSLRHDIPEYRLRKRHYLSAELATVYPSMYLFLLDKVTRQSPLSEDKLYRSYCFAAVRSIFAYLPRMIFGRHQFFSLFSVYRNGQILWWTLTNGKTFSSTLERLRRQFAIS